MTDVRRNRPVRRTVTFAGLVLALLGLAGFSSSVDAQTGPTQPTGIPLPGIQVTAPRPKGPQPSSAQPATNNAAAETTVDRQGGERANGPVVGYTAQRSATATKTDTPLLETPQSISVVPKDQFADQGSQTILEALRYTPGVSIDGFGTGVFFDWIKIRGFNAPQYLDGLRLPSDVSAFAVPRIDPYGLERVEVLKGPSSGLYGQSDPGGLINMVSKRPLQTPHYEVQGTTGSFGRLEGAFDIGGPVAGNSQFSYRIVGLARGNESEVDFVKEDKLFIAPSFTWRPSADTSFTVLAHYQRIHSDGYQQYVPGEATLQPNPFGHIPRSRYLGEPGHDYYTLEQGSIGYAFEHRFNSVLQFRQNLRYLQVTNDVAAFRGDYMIDPLTFMPSYDTMLRSPIYTEAMARNITVDNQLQADFATGALKHKVLFGFDYQNTRSSNETRSPISPLLTPQFYLPINVFNPVYGAFPIPTADMLPAFLDIKSRQEQAGLYVQDQIKLDRWTLSLTGRQDWSKVEAVSAGFYPMAGFYERSDTATTGRIGLSYLFDSGLAPYVNYSTSFVPNIGADAGGNSFKPTTGEGKEVGVKFMPRGTNLMFTAAYFDILQDNVLTSNPVNPLLSVQTDQARVRGFEFEVRGNVTRELEIVGGYSSLDPKITKSIAGNIGNYMPNVNLDQASLWAKYTWQNGPLAGFGIGAGVRYVGENFGDAANTIHIPSHTLFDASLSYDFSYLRPDLKGWKAQINATNLEDTYYVTSCQGALVYCGLGQGRTVFGTLKYTWN